MISFISITKLVCTSSGNYIPALEFRFETPINMSIRDRTIWNCYYTSCLYQKKRYYYLNTSGQLILLFLGRGMRPISCHACRITVFLLLHNFLSNNLASWASASEWIQNGLMSRINAWTPTFPFKMLYGLDRMCVCVCVCVFVCVDLSTLPNLMLDSPAQGKVFRSS
jgi:hypothetical protein